MVSSKHTTTVEVIAETRQAEKAIDRLQQKIDSLSGKFNAGGGGSGGGATPSGGSAGGGAAFTALDQAVQKLDRAADKLLRAADRMSGGGGGGGGGAGGGGGGGGGGGRGAGQGRARRGMGMASGLAQAGAGSPGGISSMLGSSLVNMDAPPLMGTFLGTAGMALGMAGMAMNQQFQAAQGKAGLQRVTSRTQTLGGGITAADALTLAGTGGMTAGEIAGQRGSFAMAAGRAKGFANVMNDDVSDTKTMLRMSLGAGVSAGTLGSFEGMMTGRGGVETANLPRAVAIGVAAGFKGAKLDQFLSSMVGAVDNLQRQGMSINTDDMSDMLAGMNVLGVQSTSMMPFVGSGMGMIGNARQTLLSPFKQLGQHAIMAEAMRGGGGFEGTLGRIEDMAYTPSSAFGGKGSAISKFAGSMTPLVLASMGVNLDDAQRMSRAYAQNIFGGERGGLAAIGTRGGTAGVSMPTDIGTASTMAIYEATKIKDFQPTELKKFTDTMLSMQTAINGFADAGVAITEALTGPLAATLGGLDTTINKLKRFLK